MGTNFYLNFKKCSKCGVAPEPLHIGKLSAGWTFALHSIPEENLTSLRLWEEKWNSNDVFITDEYDKEISPYNMRCIITAGHRKYLKSQPRSKIETLPPPTWDLVEGEFC